MEAGGLFGKKAPETKETPKDEPDAPAKTINPQQSSTQQAGFANKDGPPVEYSSLGGTPKKPGENANTSSQS